MKKRYLSQAIKSIAFSDHKMAFVSGPRQCGKTTLAKLLLKEYKRGSYYNWDDITFRRLWAKDPKQTIKPAGRRQVQFVVLDEIHKAKGWKRAIKGVFDTLTVAADILVTGSARLNVYKKGGDSLLGRYYHFRLHPFTLAELLRKVPTGPDDLLRQLAQGGFPQVKTADEYLKALMQFGGFPLPIIQQDYKKANLWRRNRIELVVREDLRDLSRIPELSQIEMLVALLPERVGSLLSLNALREDMEVSYDTIRRWLQLLADLYYVYRIQPYSKSIKRSLKKESKLYLWDYSEIKEKGSRFENLVAGHLLKACHYWSDTGEGLFELHYLRNKEKQEIDFLITKDQKPWLPIEVKSQSTQLIPAWNKFLPILSCAKGVQLVLSGKDIKRYDVGSKEVLIIPAARFLPCFV